MEVKSEWTYGVEVNMLSGDDSRGGGGWGGCWNFIFELREGFLPDRKRERERGKEQKKRERKVAESSEKEKERTNYDLG